MHLLCNDFKTQILKLQGPTSLRGHKIIGVSKPVLISKVLRLDDTFFSKYIGLE